MANLPLKYIYEFNRPSYFQAREAIFNLLDKQEEILKIRPEAGNTIFDLLNLINKFLATEVEVEEGSGSYFDIEVIRFFTPVFIEGFIKDPKNDYLFDAVALQTNLIFIALGGLGSGSEVYVKEQLVSLKDMVTFDKEIMLNTLVHLFYKDADKETINYIYDFFIPYNKDIYKQKYTWDGYFYTGIFLHFLWRYLPMIDKDKIKNLLKDYFYISNVYEIPVLSILGDVIDLDLLDFETQELVEILKKNNEKIAVKTDFSKWDNFSNIIKDYLVKTQNNKENEGFIRENLIKEIYSFQPNQDKFVNWLRQSLTTVSLVKNS